MASASDETSSGGFFAASAALLTKCSTRSGIQKFGALSVVMSQISTPLSGAAPASPVEIESKPATSQSSIRKGAGRKGVGQTFRLTS